MSTWPPDLCEQCPCGPDTPYHWPPDRTSQSAGHAGWTNQRVWRVGKARIKKFSKSKKLLLRQVEMCKNYIPEVSGKREIIFTPTFLLRAKNLEKSHFLPFYHFFNSSLNMTSVFFYILLNGLLIDHQWFQALLFLLLKYIFFNKNAREAVVNFFFPWNFGNHNFYIWLSLVTI